MKKKIFVLVATTLALSSPLSVLAECQHNNDQWEVLYKADCEDEGVETRYCSVCHEYQRRSIPKTAHCKPIHSIPMLCSRRRSMFLKMQYKHNKKRRLNIPVKFRVFNRFSVQLQYLFF